MIDNKKWMYNINRKYQNNAINLRNKKFTKKIVSRARIFLARFLIVAMLVSSFPFSTFALDVSASGGDEDGSILTTSGSTGDEGALPPVSGSTGDEGGGLPPSSGSIGDEGGSLPPILGSTGDEGSLPPVSGSSGDDGENFPPTSGSQGDGSGSLPPTSGSTGDEGSLPPVSGSTGDEGNELPPSSGSTGDENGALPPVTDSSGDEGGSLPPTSGSTGDEGGSLPPTSGSTGDEGGSLPPTSGSTGDEGSGLPPTSGSTGDEGGSLPPVSGSTGDEGGSLPPTSGSTGDEGGSLPPTSGSIGDEGRSLPPTTGSTGDEGGSLPPTSGSTGDEGGSLPPTSGSTGDEGGSLPPTSGSTGDEGGSLPPTSGSTGDEGGSLPPTSGSTGDEGGSLPPTSGSTGDEGDFVPAVCPTISIISPLSISVIEGQTFSYTFSTVTIPLSSDEISVSINSSLPTGLSFDPLTKSIKGIPIQTGTFNLSITLSIPCRSQNIILEMIITPAPIVVCPVPTISSPLSVTVAESQVFNYTFSAVTSPASVSSFTFTLGAALPSGLSFDLSTGVISGVALQAGVFNIPVTVSSPCGSSSTNLVITVTALPVVSCPVFTVSSPLSVTATLNQNFSYGFTAVSSEATTTIPSFAVFGSLPAGLVFSPGTGVISGIPTQFGVFSVSVTVTSFCGSSTANLTINVPEIISGGGGGGGGTPTVPPPVTGGGGGGGGGNNLVLVSNPSVCQLSPTSVAVNWYTNFDVGERVLFGTSSVPILGVAPMFGYQNSTEKQNIATTSHNVIIKGLIPGTQYFIRPASGFSSIGYSEVVGVELNIIAGAGRPCANVVPAVVPQSDDFEKSCSFLTDFMRISIENKPGEVVKLQTFLKQVEKLDVEVTGVFDVKTDLAVKVFQGKYFDEVLRPWGDNSEATGYVYITTKRKINQIVCGNSPINAVQQQVVDDYRNNQRNGVQNVEEKIDYSTTTPRMDQMPTIIIGQLDKGSGTSINVDNRANLATVIESVGTTTQGIDSASCRTFFNLIPCSWFNWVNNLWK